MCSEPTGGHRQILRPRRLDSARAVRRAWSPRPQVSSRPASMHTPLRRTLLEHLRRCSWPLAIGLTLVDSYRRRGKKPKPFPTTPPARRSTVGERHGHDVHLRPGPVRRHARRDRGRAAADPASRPTSGRATRSASGSRPRWPRRPTGASRSTASTTASRTSSCRRGSSASRRPMKVLRYPVYTAGLALLRPAPLRPRPPQDPRRRRRGRLRRRLQHRRAVRDRVARHARAGSPAPASGTCKRAFADFWNLHRRRRFRASERPLLLETASHLGAADPAAPQRAAAVDVPDPVDVPRGDQPGQHATSG